MRRLLILGIAITAFAFSLFLMNCGPVANNNTSTSSPAKPVALTPTPNPACSNPSPRGLKTALETSIAGDEKLKNHYSHDHANESSINFIPVPDTGPNATGFILLLEGDVGHLAFRELSDLLEPFAAPNCIKKVLLFKRGSLPFDKANLDDPKSLDVMRGFDGFGWDLTCQDPSHPCSDGICHSATEMCPATKGDNSNANGNANQNMNTNTGNTSPPANRSNNTNR